MKRLVVLLVVCAARVASADAHHVLVLRAEGSVDESLRSKIDTQVLKLAKNIGGNVEAADITFSDATAAVGCNWSDTSCKDQVLTTMGVDELIATSVMALPSGDLRVTVRRLPRSSAARDASTTIPAGQTPDARMNSDIGPVFGVAADKTATTPPPPPPPPPPPTNTTTITATGTSVPPPESGTTVIVTPPPPPPNPNTNVTAAPNGQITPMPEDTHSNRRREIYGMVGGGVLLTVGLIFLGQADSVQKEVDVAPTKTKADFQNLKDLESKGDTYKTIGGLSFLGGLVLGGVSGYFFWRDHHRANSQQARITPTVFDHGAGITLSFGAAP